MDAGAGDTRFVDLLLLGLLLLVVILLGSVLHVRWIDPMYVHLICLPAY